MPAIQNILESASITSETLTSDQRKLVDRLDRWLAEVKDSFAIASEADRFKDSLVLLRHFPLSADELSRLTEATAHLDRWRSDPPTRQELSELAHTVRQLRNAAVHRDRDDAVPRSAYGLSEGDDNA
jgi:acyl transferase domain-containing protein